MMALSHASTSAKAQDAVSFTPADDFAIPVSNGVINFAFSGTYVEANLVNDTWFFTNLQLDYSQKLAKFEVSAQNSNVTIISYRTFNTRLNTTFSGALLSYKVEGQGTQIFNIGLPLVKGEWSLLLGDDFVGEGEGWNVSPDQTITITGAKSDVTIWYFGFPESFSSGDSNNSFYFQHSVAIVTAVALVATLVFAFIIKRGLGEKQDVGKIDD